MAVDVGVFLPMLHGDGKGQAAERVRRAWVHEVDAHLSVFRETGRKAVTEALAAERAEAAAR
ncbi:hypothetical protein [Streptomyces sp. 135]|uniref:hypothetical protein n=1 Tax=Streptomyces sp. 135 TaxID=2838850 RepID=UPI001CBC0BA4|nr:hypothetical protein [Streptomyces sp. 135]